MSEPHKVLTPDDPYYYYRRVQMVEGQLHELKEAVKAWAAVASVPFPEFTSVKQLEPYYDAVKRMRKLAGCPIEGEERAQSGPALMRVYPPKMESER